MSDIVQYLLSGLSQGCIYALVALGIVLIVNVTGVYNFAQGDYVMVGGMVMAVTVGAGWSFPFAVLLCVLVVVAVALLQERITVAPVRGKVGPLGLLIATLGFGAVLRGIALAIWGHDPRRAPPFSEGVFEILGARLAVQTLWVWGATIACLAAVVYLFRYTDTGRAMRASAMNPVAARLHGIRTGATSMQAFLLAGALSGLVAAVTVPLTGARWDSGLTVTLIAFIAAALGGFRSPSRAVLFGLALGVLESVSAGLISSAYRQAIVYGSLIVYLLVRDLVGHEGVVTRMRKQSRSRVPVGSEVESVRERIRMRTGEFVERLERDRPTARGVLSGVGLRSAIPVGLFGLALLIPTLSSDVGLLDAAVFIVLGAIGATGLGLILGLAGQLSLGHAVFYIVSGYGVATLTVNTGWAIGPAIVAAIGASMVVAYVVGRLTVRLSGFNLAIATLAIQLIALVFVVQQYPQGITGLPVLEIFGVAFIEAEHFYYLGLALLAVCLLIARNIWFSQTGLALRAVGRDEVAAESLGLDVSKLKLRILVLGATMAAVAGVLWALYSNFAASSSWNVTFTIDLLTYVIVGGVASPFGAAVGAVAVGGVQHVIQQTFASTTAGSTQYEIILSGAFLVFFILLFRDGLTALPARLAVILRRAPAAGPDDEASVQPDSAVETDRRPAPAAAGEGAAANGSVVLVKVSELTKQFGQLSAVSGIDFQLRSGQITAMIGPNGAGKSTLINMLSGVLVPTTGGINIMGRAIVGLRPAEIGQSGVSRTFQTPRLFEGLTTLENVILARQRFRRSGLASAALLTPRCRREEAIARAEAHAWLDFVGLGGDADTVATSLSVGRQRLAELARALATDPCVLLLDEPAAGLDSTETDALAQVIGTIRKLEIAVLLVEHDMGIVMSIADQVIVIDEGEKISEGEPATVGSDPAVVEAYLGVVHK